MKRLALLFFIGFPLAAWAQGSEPAKPSGVDPSFRISSSTSGKLDYTLSTLKESVDRLSEENRKLSAGNNQVKLKLRALSDALKSEEEQGVQRKAQSLALEPRYQKKMAERAALEAQEQQGQGYVDRLNAQREAMEQALQVKDEEDAVLTARADELSRELQDIRLGLVPGEDHAAELEALRAQQQEAQQRW